MSKAIIVSDLFMGDMGKGSIVSALTQKYNSILAVRFSGGAQCKHNVIDDSGRKHAFAQFGAGTLGGAKTLLDHKVLVNPLTMIEEAKVLQKIGIADPWAGMYVHGDCLITTPYHQALNRLKEISRGVAKHGSCGLGIGETADYAIQFPYEAPRVWSGNSSVITLELLLGYCLQKVKKLDLDWANPLVEREMSLFNIAPTTLHSLFADWTSKINVVLNRRVDDLLNSAGTTIWEGAQGVLLDQDFRFQPHVTWSTTTDKYARKTLERAGIKDICRVGVVRTYATRHGTGPFPSEFEVRPDWAVDPNNPENPWQGGMRFGRFNFDLVREAIEYNGGIDFLAVTHCDILPRMDIWEYIEDGVVRRAHPDDALELIESVLGIPVGIKSLGPRTGEKEFSAEFY